MDTPQQPPAHAKPEDLQHLALFRGFDKDSLALVAGLADLRTVEAGVTFLSQGEKGKSMFVILEGSVAINYRDASGKAYEVARVEAGDFFGEVALMDQGIRCADVVTLDHCRMVEISHSDITVMAMGNTSVALKLFISIARTLVDRARDANAKYVQALSARGG